MKRSLVTALLFVAGLGVGTARADYTLDEVHAAAKIATTDFERDHAEHAAHFVGYKVWKSGENAKVKIYVNHGGHAMEFDYLCHKHDDATECHAL